MNTEKFIERLHRLAHRQWAKQARQLAVTYSEYEYLCAISDLGGQKTDKNNHGQHLQDVIDEMGVKKASASSMVIKLEERGLVERLPCRYDARAQHIMLTEAGRSLLIQGEAVYATVAQAFFQRLSKDEALTVEAAIKLIDQVD